MDFEVSKEEILKLFMELQLNQEEKNYLNFHSKRLAYTTTLVQRCVQQYKIRNMLDIGPHFLTYCFLKMLRPRPKISTLGFSNFRLLPAGLADNHFEMDLNKCSSTEIPSSQSNFDFIVFAETIEHLYTSPKIVLFFLRKLLTNERDALILIQTPNAVSLLKRIKMLLGYNPFELIREDKTNPGHFREYTRDEIERYAFDTGFDIQFREYCTYWSTGKMSKIIDLFPSFREGMTLLLVKKVRPLNGELIHRSGGRTMGVESDVDLRI